MKKTPLALVMASAVLAISACSEPADTKVETTEAEQVIEQHATDTERSSATWEGYYSGTLPCASCAGIKTGVTLKQGGTYEITQEYIDSEEPLEVSDEGLIIFDSEGAFIVLGDHKFKIEKDALIMLNDDAEEPTGELADLYVLKKSV